MGMAVSGRFRAQEVIDSGGYLDFSWKSLKIVLSDFRTPGYPAFVAAVKTIAGDSSFAIPLMQYLVYASAVVLMFFGLHKFLGDAAKALVGSATLLYSSILHNFCSDISTDTLAAAAGLMVCGFILLAITEKRAIYHVAVGIAVIAGWQIRPAYLFLIPFVPVVTCLAAKDRKSVV